MIETFTEDAARDRIGWLSAYLGADWLAEQLEARRLRCEEIGRWVPPRVHGNPIVDIVGIHRGDLARLPFANAVQQASGAALLEMAANVHHVATRLTKPKSDALRELLRKKATARGYLYQCKIAAHYVRDGYEIADFSIGERRGGDVVIAGSSETVEIQCKALELGAGRRIAAPIFNLLAAAVLNEAERLAWRGEIRFLCDVNLKLEKSRDLATEIVRRLRSPRAQDFRMGDMSVRIVPAEDVVPWESVNHTFEDPGRDRLRRPHIAVLGNYAEPRGVRVFLEGISALGDKVIGKLLTVANVAAAQLEGRHPGIVCVDTPETIDWLAVSENGFLDRCVSEGFRHLGESRVSALAFTSEGGDRNAYVYRNPAGRPALRGEFRVVGSLRGPAE